MCCHPLSKRGAKKEAMANIVAILVIYLIFGILQLTMTVAEPLELRYRIHLAFGGAALIIVGAYCHVGLRIMRPA